MYLTGRHYIGISEQHEIFFRESDDLNLAALTNFLRVVRRKGVRLSSAAMEKISHSADVAVRLFYHTITSWKALREKNPMAHPLYRRSKYFGKLWKMRMVLLHLSIDNLGVACLKY